MSEKLPFEPDGRSQDDQSVPGLPFEQVSEVPPPPFALNDAAPLPFVLEPDPDIPALPFSLDDDEPAPIGRSFDEPNHFSLDAPVAPLPFTLEASEPDEPRHYSLESEPSIPALPFSLDDEPTVVSRSLDEPNHFSLDAEADEPERSYSLEADPTPAPSFSLDAEPDPLPFLLTSDEPVEAPPVSSFEPEPQIAPLPFSLTDDEPVASLEIEATVPPLPFSLVDDEPESAPLPFALTSDGPPAADEPKSDLAGAGFFFEEGEIDSPFFRRLAQEAEPEKPKMPPMGVPAMPPAARPAASSEPAPPPPFPPAYQPARETAEAQSRPTPPPPPGYQPSTPTFETASRPVPPAINQQPPVPAYEPPAPTVEPPGQAGVIDLSQYEPMTPPSNSKAPILTGEAVPTHEAPPMAKDVSSALAAMKARLASSRQAQPDPNAELLRDPSEGMDMSLAPKSSKPPEIWEYRVGQSIFREGELTYELFMLMEGIVDIYVGGDKVATLNAETAAGAYLGEIGALLRLPRTATVKAVTSCKFLVFPDAKRLFEEDPEFGIKLSTILAQRLARSNESMEMVMRALYRAKVKDEVISAVKGAFQGKESTYYKKKGWFG